MRPSNWVKLILGHQQKGWSADQVSKDVGYDMMIIGGFKHGIDFRT